MSFLANSFLFSVSLQTLNVRFSWYSRFPILQKDKLSRSDSDSAMMYCTSFHSLWNAMSSVDMVISFFSSKNRPRLSV